tara:strand:- start:908 stop:1312 length:405 start_codon:yes stop_codon:yes gene_type:complete
MGEFSRNMNRLAGELERGMDRVYRRAFLSVDTAVVLATPVDTGRARGNWIPSIGRPISASRPNTFGASVSLGEGRTVAATLRSRNRAYISNNLPYIQRLNEGWSRQAPTGFVQLAIHGGLGAIRGGTIIVSGGL